MVCYNSKSYSKSSLGSLFKFKNENNLSFWIKLLAFWSTRLAKNIEQLGSVIALICVLNKIKAYALSLTIKVSYLTRFDSKRGQSVCVQCKEGGS